VTVHVGSNHEPLERRQRHEDSGDLGKLDICTVAGGLAIAAK